MHSKPALHPVKLDGRFDLRSPVSQHFFSPCTFPRNQKQVSTHLSPRPLTPNRQSQRLPTTTVGPGLLQPLDIIQILSAEVIFDLHVGQCGRDIQHLLVGQLAHFAGWVDMEPGEETRRSVFANTKERLEGFLLVVRIGTLCSCCGGRLWACLDEIGLGKADSKNKDLVDVSQLAPPSMQDVHSPS